MKLDRGILLAVFFLLGLGLVQVYSSSYIFATEIHGDGLFFFRKQLLFSVMAVVAIFAAAQLSTVGMFRVGVVFWILAVMGVAATFHPALGVRVGGAHRWLHLPFGFRFEPAELLRVTYPFVLAPLMAKFSENQLTWRWWMTFFLVMAPLGLLYSQPDFGSFVIILGITGFLFMAFGLRWRWILGGLAVGIPVLAAMIAFSPYRRVRVEAFLNPWADPTEKGFQVIQSMLSFYSGGATGVGLGQGQGKLFFLPEAHTDFTLAVLAEEMGFVGFVILLMVYGFVIYRGFQLALSLKPVAEKALALGFSLLLVLAVFINVGVAMGMLPTKGLTLPLISYGGSSLFCTGLLLGWLLALEKYASRGPT